ncbi:chain-length determining protein [Shewanella sp. 10N.286.51.B7]|uniref:GumC family protein n=1 Tax=unclassified Shewanella TaxID=196818 RepID=UPI000C836F32|nr:MULTISPECIES: polysaccharide biosynthesis tyrosine autokinase [unclassified Shewanella]MCC4833065.1 polysaccharide biosynthesis tyrosine autokinase [Shewanella sp. 10N.7]PMG78427.1 chain-length determining protein [Shewanella sp. 10N.286.51.B7]
MISTTPIEKTSPILPEQLIDFKKLFKPLLYFKWRILAFSILVTALTVFVVMSMKPIYSATSTLLIESEQASAIKIDEVYGINSGQREYYLTQFEILKSRSIAERVFNELDLENHPQFQPQPSLFKQFKNNFDFLPKEESAPVDHNKVYQQRVSGFASNIFIRPIRKTQLVNISYETPDPELASLVSNAVGDAYILSQLEAKAGMTQKANIWLGGRLEDLRVNLDASEHRLEQFRIKNGLVDVEGVTALDAKELQRLSDEITVARSRKAQADSFMAVVKKYGANDIGRLESLPEVTSHLSIQNVKREVSIVERKVSELKQVYGPKHPKLIAANAELATVEKNLRIQIGRLVQGIEDEAQTATQNLKALEQQFNSSKGDFQDLSTIDTTYKRLVREVNTNQQLFESFLSRQKETEVTGDFDSPVARFTDRAVTPYNPIKPNKKLIVVAAFLASFIFAMVVVLVLDALNDTIKTTDDVEKVLSQRALGYIPKADKKASYDEVNFAFFDSNAKMHAESVRTIRTSLSLMALGQELRIIEVSSSFPNEGKTTVAMNLAFAFSGMEKVLIIDADMRKPNIGSRFGLPNYQPGLSNVLSGADDINSCIVRDVKPNVDVLAAGAIPLNPQELLSSPYFAEVMTILKQQYTKIIVDTPPIQAVSDALVIAPHSDAVVTVVKAATTRSEAVKLTLAKLYQARGKVFGVVLNQLNIKDAQQYHGQYGYYQPYESNEVEVQLPVDKAS